MFPLSQFFRDIIEIFKLIFYWRIFYFFKYNNGAGVRNFRYIFRRGELYLFILSIFNWVLFLKSFQISVFHSLETVKWFHSFFFPLPQRNISYLPPGLNILFLLYSSKIYLTLYKYILYEIACIWVVMFPDSSIFSSVHISNSNQNEIVFISKET